MLCEFEMVVPKTLPEALQILAERSSDVAPVAGGTNLVVDMRDGRHTPKVVMSVDRLDAMKGIRQDDGYVWIGGGVTISELLISPLIGEYAPALRDAARMFASPLVRNRATIAGNVADGSPAADTVPPLMAANAEVQLSRLSGSRWLALDQFFLHVRKTAREADELITAVRFPISKDPTTHGYYKLGLRKADAISVVSAAVVVAWDETGLCREARIAVGSVAPTVLRIREAEKILCGNKLTAERMAEAGQLAAKAASPISDVRASAEYRRQMAEQLVRRVLRQAAG